MRGDRVEALAAFALAFILGACRSGPTQFVEPVAGVDRSSELRRVSLPVDRDVRGLTVAPSGEYFVLNTAGPTPTYGIVYDRSVHVPGVQRSKDDEIAFASTSDALLALGFDRVCRIRAVPSFGATSSLAEWLVSSEVLMTALPRRPGWALVPMFGGQVVRLDDDALRIGATGNAGFGIFSAVAVDESTGLGVFVGNRSQLEAYDFDRMEPVFVVELPCGQAGTSVCVVDGCAWVATADGSGTVIRVDLRTRSVAEVIDVGFVSSTYVACSPRTGEVIAIAAVPRRSDTGLTHVRFEVFDASGGRAREKSTLDEYLDTYGLDLHVALLDRSRSVVLAGGAHLWIWDLGSS